MKDEMFDRDYQSARTEVNAGIDRALLRFVRGLRAGFEALHRAQWQAPWQTGRRPARRRGGLG